MKNPLSIVFVVLSVMMATPCPDKDTLKALQADLSDKDKELRGLYRDALKKAENDAKDAKKNCTP